MKILTAESNLASATNISNTPVVRVYNSDSSAITLTRKDNTGTTIGSYSVPPSKVIYCEKSYTDTLEGGAALKAAGVGYSEELEIICLGNGGGGGSNSIVTNGLIMHMDPGDTNSYSGSGTTWYDLTSNNNDWTINGTVTHGNDSVATSTKVFSMTNQYVSDNNNIEMDNDISTVMHGTSDSDYTAIVASRYNTTTGGQRNGTFGNTTTSPYFLLGHWSNTTGVCYQGSWIDNNSGYGSIGDTDWGIYTTTRDQSEDAADFWVNDTKHVNDSSNGSTGPKKLRAGGAAMTHGDSTCCIGVILVYDRVLTDSEIEQNYDALKTRYGLS